MDSITGFARGIWELLGVGGEQSATDSEKVLREARKGQHFNHKTQENMFFLVIVRHIVTCSGLCTLEKGFLVIVSHPCVHRWSRKRPVRAPLEKER